MAEATSSGRATVLDVYVSEAHPYYQVWVDGVMYDAFTMRAGHPPLTHSQMVDVAAGYKEALTVHSVNQQEGTTRGR